MPAEMTRGQLISRLLHDADESGSGRSSLGLSWALQSANLGGFLIDGGPGSFFWG